PRRGQLGRQPAAGARFDGGLTVRRSFHPAIVAKERAGLKAGRAAAAPENASRPARPPRGVRRSARRRFPVPDQRAHAEPEPRGKFAFLAKVYFPRKLRLTIEPPQPRIGVKADLRGGPCGRVPRAAAGASQRTGVLPCVSGKVG